MGRAPGQEGDAWVAEAVAGARFLPHHIMRMAFWEGMRVAT